jgi:hypothetical protein
MKSAQSLINASPETRIQWECLMDRFTVDSIVDCTYIGARAGSAFTVYDPNIIYFVVEGWGSSSNFSTSNETIQFYDEMNAINFYYNLVTPYWNATAGAVNYYQHHHPFKNKWFGRISTTCTYLHFIGYQINIIP